jgi:hypothetical protein
MSTQPNIPSEINIEEEVQNVTQEQDLYGLSVKDLKDRVKRTNDKFSLKQGDPGYIKSTGKRDEIISALIEQEILNTVHDVPVASAKGEVVQVKLSQVHTNPRNYRHDIDYEDKQLVHDIKVSGGLLKAPIVRPTGKKDNNGRDLYEIVGGNRSTEALRRMLVERGESLDDYDLHVIVRNYEGSVKQREVQEILEMLNDNESVRPMSPRDRLHAYRDLERHGLDRTSIAKKQGVSPAYVSQVLKLEFLPERILDLVHFDFNKERIEVQGVEAMRQHGVPFIESEDGVVSVAGITLNNANTMASLFPRKPAQARPDYETAIQDWDQKVMDVQDFLMREEVMTAARFKSGSEFKNWLKRFAEDSGVIEKPEVEAKETKPSQPKKEDKQEAVEEKVEVSKKKEKEAKVPDVGVTAYEAAKLLESDKVDFSFEPNWSKLFAEELKMGSVAAFNAFKFLYSTGILVDVKE